MSKTKRLMLLLCLTFSAFTGLVMANAEDDEFNFAEGLFVQPDYESALEEFQGFAKKFPETARMAKTKFRIAECLFRTEKAKEAVTAYTEALAAYPDDENSALGAYNLGRIHLQLEDPASAIEPFTIAAAKGEADLKEAAQVAKGECLLKTEKYQDAVTLYDGFLTDFPKSESKADIYFSKAWAFSALQDHDKTIEAVTALTTEFPDYEQAVQAKLLMSDAYTAQEKYDEVDKILKEIVDSKKGGEDVLLRLAWNKFQAGDKEQAGATFMQFADSYPESGLLPTALYNAGIAFYDLKKFDKAVDAFTRLVATNTESPEALEAPLWLGLSHYELQQYDKAVEAFKPILENDKLDEGKKSSLYYNYAEALVALEKFDEAITWFNKLLESFPASPYAPNARYALALAKQKKEDLPGAIEALEGLLKNHPDTELKPQALFALAEYYYRLKQPDKALEPLKELAAAEGVSDKVLYRLAWVQFDLKQYADAQATFEKLSAMPESTFKLEALYMAGSAAEQSEQNDKAVEFYNQLQAMEGDDDYIKLAMSRLAMLQEGDASITAYKAYEKRFPEGKHLNALKLRVAEMYFDKGDNEAATTLYLDLLAQEPDEASAEAAHYGLGWCHFKQEKVEEADAEFAQIKSDPLDSDLREDALLKRAEIAYNKKDYEAAKIHFLPLTEKENARAERALYMSGWCARWLKDSDTQIAVLKKLLTNFPGSEFYIDATMRLAEAYNTAEKFDEAKALLTDTMEKKADKVNEDFSLLYLQVLVGTQSWNDVLIVGKAFLEKFPESSKVYLANFQMGIAAKALGAGEDAKAYFKKTISQTETIEAAQAQFNIATLFYSKQEYSQAAKQFLRVEMLYDYKDLSAKSLYHCAESFVKGENVKRAKTYLKKLTDNYGDTEWAKKGAELIQE